MKNYNKGLAIVVLSIFLWACGAPKIATTKVKDIPKTAYNVANIAFYNLENLFDTIDGTNKDEEFLPDGTYHWTGYKYKAKLKNMAYAISQIGIEITPKGPDILGVSEVENRGVLEDLVKQKSIIQNSYQIVHYDSPDRRGIDVGLLYNPRTFVVTSSKVYPLEISDSEYKTRDQLLVTGYLLKEKVHIIVNHWPSRYGGEAASAPNRVAAARLTKSIVDSLNRAEKSPKIIIMGDLNDDPTDKSVAKILDAKRTSEKVKTDGLFNTLWKTYDSGVGSLAYRGEWNLFDQIIISKSLLNDNKNRLRFWKAQVCNKKFLIQQEGQYRGTPLRTHSGGIWLNGYSDHFPTYILLVKKK